VELAEQEILIRLLVEERQEQLVELREVRV
jgi:hypothetical protein